jgi:biotin carboxylase
LQSGIVLFLGMVRRGEYETLQERGLALGVLMDTNNKQRLADVSRFALVERFDFSRPLEELVAKVREIQESHGISCLFNVIEFYVAQTAAAAAQLGLPSIAAASAQLCLDKSVMRQRFQERIGPSASARFEVIDSEADLVRCAREMGYPVFLQPSNVSASMWSTSNADEEMLLRNYRAMQAEVPAYYERLGKPGTRLKVILAEYMQGANTSIDCLIDSQGTVYMTPIVDVLTGKDIGIDDYHHFARIVPSRVPLEAQRELAELATAGVLALDMRSCAAHVEFIGSRLGEIAARPGGNRPRILNLAYGLDELNAYHEVLLGGVPDLGRKHEGAAAVVTPFPARNGTLRAIGHLDALVKLPGYLYHEVRGQAGQPVGLARNGYRAPLYIELQSDDAETVRRSVDTIASWSDIYEVE